MSGAFPCFHWQSSSSTNLPAQSLVVSRASPEVSSHASPFNSAKEHREGDVDFNSILIGSENPERLVEYYTKVLGEPGFSDSGYTGWQLGSGFVTVGPHSEVKGKNPPRAGSSGTSRARTWRATSSGSRPPGRSSSPRRTLRGRARLVDRDLRRPRRQLLPAHEPDGDVARAVCRPTSRSPRCGRPGRRSRRSGCPRGGLSGR